MTHKPWTGGKSNGDEKTENFEGARSDGGRRGGRKREKGDTTGAKGRGTAGIYIYYVNVRVYVYSTAREKRKIRVMHTYADAYVHTYVLVTIDGSDSGPVHINRVFLVLAARNSS